MRAIFGTMNIGQQVFGDQAREMLSIYKDYGGVELDTAYVYNDGLCEEELGKCLKDPSLQGFTVDTKVNPRVTGRLDHDAVEGQLRTSLKRLGVSNVGILYFHFPDPNTPIESAVRAAAEAYADQRFNELGVSNYSVSQIVEIIQACDDAGCPRPTVYEGVYNALSRNVENELMSFLSEVKMRFYAYNPLAGGMLTGRYSSIDESPEDGRFALRAKSYKGRYWKESYFDAVRLIDEACRESGISIVEASYRWLARHSALSNKRGDAIIIGASKPSQLGQNLDALSAGPLPESVIAAFDSAWEVTRDDAPPYYRCYSG